MTRFLTLATVFAATVGGTDYAMGQNYDLQIPSSWSSGVTNTYFPLAPGTKYEFAAQTDEGQETNTVEVLADTKVVHGVTATVVWDRVFLNGSLVEATFDWYAQDGDGNVWYVGEDSKEYKNGQVVSSEGSWEWGVKGALPGVIMWANPAARLGDAYRQEFLRGHAEDWGKVVALNQSVTVPYGSFAGCIKTEDWSGLETAREHKFYCPQVGTVLEVEPDGGRVELTVYTKP